MITSFGANDMFTTFCVNSYFKGGWFKPDGTSRGMQFKMLDGNIYEIRAWLLNMGTAA